MALVCYGGVSQLQKFSQRVIGGCEIILQRETIFTVMLGDCEIISQPRAIFAGASFGLRNLTDHGFSLAPELLLTLRDLPSISLQFLLN